MKKESIVLSSQPYMPPWLPIVHGINIFSFTLALILYLGGFWGGIISLFVLPSGLFVFFGFAFTGLVCIVPAYYLTEYECSFHSHDPLHTCP